MSYSVHEDVRREVARCIGQNAILRVAPVAVRIAAGPHCPLTANSVALMLMQAGAAAAVPMEIETLGVNAQVARGSRSQSLEPVRSRGRRDDRVRAGV